ncbi:MAG: tRNA preQ1(34) S-adenosylmethionine ribosyltransferase-isomerase QueA [Desulfobacteraceae bacterium]|nr:tRNA preQ1(34) S-adenosylmethionine ribosyltransferase-isomerase QueA [Desulfobacteraceae bacterium]
MKVDLFDFDLPTYLIAKHPARPRDSAKLLDITGDAFADRVIRELPNFLRPGDLLIGNNTRVIPARLKGRRGRSGAEVTLHKQESHDTWLAFAKRSRKLKPDDTIQFADEFHALVVQKKQGGEVLLKFNRSGADLVLALDKYGEMPLPPYIKRNSGNACNDREDYQTIFARHNGAVAAPTAGLHFTDSMLESLEKNKIRLTTITLHVGAGTFQPVKTEDTDNHKMHSEWGHISEKTVELIKKTKKSGGRVIAVGTTCLRLIETVADDAGEIRPFTGETDIFITPGYKFKSADMLLTNFHLPRSTLFMLVSAFAGLEKMHAAYEYAKQQNYRFYSYGDCCLLKRET